MKGRWESAIRPSIGIRTIKAQRVSIVSVNIYATVTSPRSQVTKRRGIIADERNHDSCRSILVFYHLKIRSVRESDICRGLRVLILGLEQDDGSPIGDLRFCKDGPNLLNIARRRSANAIGQ